MEIPSNFCADFVQGFNHLSYAVQWFLFALIAIVIYGLAVRQKLKKQEPAA